MISGLSTCGKCSSMVMCVERAEVALRWYKVIFMASISRMGYVTFICSRKTLEKCFDPRLFFCCKNEDARIKTFCRRLYYGKKLHGSILCKRKLFFLYYVSCAFLMALQELISRRPASLLHSTFPAAAPSRGRMSLKCRAMFAMMWWTLFSKSTPMYVCVCVFVSVC